MPSGDSDKNLGPQAVTRGEPVDVLARADGPTAQDAASVTGPPLGDMPLPVFTSLPRVPDYEILEELGRGGMGVVYRARQIGLNRFVALKMILAGPFAEAGLQARFRAEAAAVARLQHPNVVQIFHIGEVNGLPYFSLELVEGGTLAAHLAGRPQPPAAAAHLVATLARAIHAAHQRGIIHRDLKPANILLTPDGIPKIGDFGLAKQLDAQGHSSTGAILGTASYMAPEQARAESAKIGPATDVYALGAILYEMLTGRPPFRGDTLVDILDKVRFQPPEPPSRLRPDIGPELERICLRCLEKAPEARYPSAAALADDLQPPAAAPSSHHSVVVSAPSNRRRWLGAALAGISLAALIVALIVSRPGPNPVEDKKPGPEQAKDKEKDKDPPDPGPKDPPIPAPERYQLDLVSRETRVRNGKFSQGQRVRVNVTSRRVSDPKTDVDVEATCPGFPDWIAMDHRISTDSQIEFVAPLTGDYPIKVINLGPGSAQVEVLVQVLPNAGPALERSFIALAAKKIGWLALRLVQGERVQVNVVSELNDKATSVDLGVTRAKQTEWVALDKGVGGNRALKFTAPAAGDYQLQLINNGPGFAICEVAIERTLPQHLVRPAPPQKHALLIGVRDYRLKFYQGTLKYTEDDVEGLARFLREDGWPRQNIRILSQWSQEDNPALAPTSANIRARLAALAEQTTGQDTVLVALSGSGLMIGDPPQYCFLPADADLDDPRTLITQSDLFAALGKCRAPLKLFFADTCQEPVKAGLDAKLPPWPPLTPPPPGLAALFACSPGEISMEHADLRHGVFTHFLLEGLRGQADADRDGVVRLGELTKFTRRFVQDFTTRKFVRRQNPTVVSTIPEETEVVRVQK